MRGSNHLIQNITGSGVRADVSGHPRTPRLCFCFVQKHFFMFISSSIGNHLISKVTRFSRNSMRVQSVLPFPLSSVSHSPLDVTNIADALNRSIWFSTSPSDFLSVACLMDSSGCGRIHPKQSRGASELNPRVTDGSW